MKSSSFAVIVLVGGSFLPGCVAEDKEVGAVHNPVPAPTSPTNLPLGASCVLGDEWEPMFSGYGASEVNIAEGHSGCASGICLANHFQGRQNCPYGQAAPGDPNQFDSPPCLLPDGRARVATAVEPQLVDRRAEDTVTCSCRCDGPAGTGDFCSCPNGFECVPMIEFAGVTTTRQDGGFGHLVGSYCIKAGTAYDPTMEHEPCDWETQSCGPG